MPGKRPEQFQPGKSGWRLEALRFSAVVVSALLLGTAGFLSLYFLGCLYLLLAGASSVGAVAIIVLIFKPAALLAAAAGTALFFARARSRSTRLACGVGILGLLAVSHFYASTPHLAYWDMHALRPLFLTQGGALALIPLLRRVSLLPAISGAVHFVVPVVLTVGVLSFVSPPSRLHTNHLGLISGKPGSSEIRDFSNHTNKDDYPPCSFSYNSLGYRDIEPPPVREGRRRVLVVGDSYVWGDGIPSNEETLAYRLREELEARAPGRFDVMSAAFPGLGAYGYSRFVEVLQPRLKADTVVIGFLGDVELDPFGPQLILDSLPRNRLARNLVVNLRAARAIHEASVTHHAAVWNSSVAREWSARITKSFGTRAAERGYRAFIFDYTMGRAGHDFGGARVLAGPPELAYDGYRTALWYAKDAHPKPALNRIFAGLLAEALLKTAD